MTVGPGPCPRKCLAKREKVEWKKHQMKHRESQN